MKTRNFKVAAILNMSSLLALGAAPGQGGFQTHCVSEGVVERLDSRAPLEKVLSLLRDPSPEMRVYQWSSHNANPLHGYMSAALELNEADRHAALAALPASPLSKSVKTILALSLYDEPTWLKNYRWADASYAPFDAQIQHKKPWLNLIQKMPPKLKVRLDAEVTAEYADAPKSNQAGNTIVDWPQLTAGPKRGVDAYLRLTNDLTRPFFDRVHAGESPVDAYAHVLNQQRKRYFDGLTVGAYDPKISLAIAREVQTVLRRSPHFSKEEYVNLVGSFVNGKAVLATSDIDLFFKDVKPAPAGSQAEALAAQVAAQEKDRLRLGDLSRAIRAYAAAKFGSKRVLQPEKTAVQEERLGVLNPFVIRIYRYRIELLVYPPRTLEQSSPAPVVIPI